MKRRLLVADGYYHVFNRGVNKQDICWQDYDRQLFMRIFCKVREKYKLRLFAFCIMRNHYHLFVHTRESNLDRAMQMLQAQYVQYVNLRYDRVGHLFQGRYQSRKVEADPYAIWLVRYIHRNPVEAGVNDYAGYAWSSYRHYLDPNGPPDWLDTGWILSQFHTDSAEARRLFAEFHAQDIPESSERSERYGVLT